MVKKLTLSLCIVFLLSLGYAHAAEEGIESIHIAVNLQKDGSALITETWEINDVYKGTEYYIALYGLKDMTVSQLTVTDDTGTLYKTLDEWDSKASFDDKAFRCGVLSVPKEDGYEICWGISQLGNRSYTVQYVLSNLCKGYHDATGFYHRFVSKNLSSDVKNASITLSMEDVVFTPDNLAVSAFGFTGTVSFSQGRMVATTSEALKGRNHMTLLVRFADGIIAPTPANGSFQDVSDRAQQKTNPVTIIAILSSVLLAAGGVTALLSASYRRIKLADGSVAIRTSKQHLHFTQAAPFDGNLFMAYCALLLDPWSSVPKDVLAATITQWSLDGNIVIQEVNGNTSLKLVSSERMNVVEKELFLLMEEAAENHSLSIDAWGQWIRQNPSALTQWQETVKSYGNDLLCSAACIATDASGKLRFTASGLSAYESMLSFYYHLKSLKKEPDKALSRAYWVDYICFSALFGLSQSVVSQLGHNAPDDLTQFCADHHMSHPYMIYAMCSGQHYSRTATSNLSDDSDLGGFSSGGGGFSGGGGGGSR